MPSFALFEYRDNLDHEKFTGHVVIPEGTTCVGYHAFHSRKDITSVYLPDSVNVISDRAFFGCENLKSVRLPNGMFGIGEESFCGCDKLVDINLPDSVNRIGKNAFSGCKGLENEQGLIILNNRLICCNSDSCTEINVPDGVTSIEEHAFSLLYGSSLERVTLPDGLSCIGAEAFAGCRKLKSINIPSSVRKIGKHVFFGCYGLAGKNGTVVVGNVVYDYCKSDGDSVVPENVTRIDSWVTDKIQRDLDNKYKHVSLAAPGVPFSYMNEKKIGMAAALGFIRHPDLFKNKDEIAEYALFISLHRKQFLSYILNGDHYEVINALADIKKINTKNIEKDWLEPAMQVKAEKCIETLESLCDSFGGRKKNKKQISIEGRELWDATHFSLDGKKLIMYEDEPGIKEYHVPEGTQVICSEAFSRTELETIYLPGSIRKIEDYAFSVRDGYSLCVHFPDNMKKISVSYFDFYTNIAGYRTGTEKYFTPIRSAEQLSSLPSEFFHFVNVIYTAGGLKNVPNKAKKSAVEGFIYTCEHDPDLLSEWKDGYLKYICSHEKDYIKQAISNEFLARLMMKEKLLTEKGADTLTDLVVSKAGSTELVAEILDYKNDRFGSQEQSDPFSLSDDDPEMKRIAALAERQEQIRGQKGISGIAFVRTGDLENFGTEKGYYRDYSDLKAFIEERGGFLRSAVSSKTDYVICNDDNSDTTKSREARRLGIPVITEKEFLEMAGGL